MTPVRSTSQRVLTNANAGAGCGVRIHWARVPPGGEGGSPGCGFREALRPPGQVSSTTSARVVGPLRASCGDLPAHPHAGFAAEAADVLAEGDVELGKGGVTDTH